MITLDQFRGVVDLLGEQGQDDIRWAEACALPKTPEDFALEAAFVICNSGMRATVARGIYERVRAALPAGQAVISAFRHPGKAHAIEFIWAERRRLHVELQHRARLGDEQLLAFCASLPWIGGITKFHLAKNFGLQLAKPDVHLQRLADREGCTPQALCERLAAASGWKVATVDTLLWRACANGIINSRTGAITGEQP